MPKDDNIGDEMQLVELRDKDGNIVKVEDQPDAPDAKQEPKQDPNQE